MSAHTTANVKFSIPGSEQKSKKTSASPATLRKVSKKRNEYLSTDSLQFDLSLNSALTVTNHFKYCHNPEHCKTGALTGPYGKKQLFGFPLWDQK